MYFVRHGEGVGNAARIFSCWQIESPLTERGILQAQETAEFLKNKGIQNPVVYASPVKRALETGQIIAQKLGAEIKVYDGLREVNVGELEGKAFSEETWAVYLGVSTEWFAGNVHAAIPGGEDHIQLWNRTRAGYEQIFLGKSGVNAIVAGHSGIFTATIKDLCPELDVVWLQNAECYNCSITEVDVWTENGKLRGELVDWASYSHLSEDVLIRVPGVPPRESMQSSRT